MMIGGDKPRGLRKLVCWESSVFPWTGEAQICERSHYASILRFPPSKRPKSLLICRFVLMAHSLLPPLGFLASSLTGSLVFDIFGSEGIHDLLKKVLIHRLKKKYFSSFPQFSTKYHVCMLSFYMPMLCVCVEFYHQKIIDLITRYTANATSEISDCSKDTKV